MKSKLRYLIIIVAVIALGAWVYSRWNAWFGKHPEPAFTVAAEPHNVMLTFGNKPGMRYVTWQSAIASDNAYIMLRNYDDSTVTAIPAERTDFKSDSGMLSYYRATLDAPSSDYSYYVSVDSLSSEPFDVKGFDETRDKYRFVVIGDVQNIHDTIRPTVARIDSVFAPDFWVQAGDLIERPHIQYWDRFFYDFADVCGKKPFVAILGNHDFHKSLIRKPDDRFFWTFPYFEDYESGVKAGVANFHFGPVSFYMFDSTRGLFNLIRQKRWFAEDNTSGQSDSWKVVVMHHPPFSARSAFNNLIVKYVMLPALNDADIDVLFSAHEHTYQRLQPNKDRTFYQYISHFSPKNYVDRNNKDRYFLMVDVSRDKMSVYTFNDSLQAIDTLNLAR